MVEELVLYEPLISETSIPEIDKRLVHWLDVLESTQSGDIVMCCLNSRLKPFLNGQRVPSLSELRVSVQSHIQVLVDLLQDL